jgi:hypothetical protein
VFGDVLVQSETRPSTTSKEIINSTFQFDILVLRSGARARHQYIGGIRKRLDGHSAFSNQT